MRGAEPGGSPAGPCHPPWDPDHRLSTGLPFRCTEQEKSAAGGRGGEGKLRGAGGTAAVKMANTFLLHLLSAWTQNHDGLRELHFLSPQDRGGLRSLQKQKQSKKK